ncbi:MAG: spermidine/putrescine ABC transporter substrate-binding protein [Actinomycetota bacterium]|nr:spermidine/putrescine ABC transporter substrate-binding protein [Actinomycetota bacterium]
MPEYPSHQVPPDLLRGLTGPRISRRAALRAGGLSVVAVSLAACGVSGGKSGPTGSAATHAAKSFWDKQTKTGQLSFANWPLYMDVNPKNKNDHPSLDLFTKKTGIKIKYSEVIQEDASFFGKIQPELAASQGTGYDLMVITNGIYLDKLIELNYLIPLDQSRMTNFNTNASPLVKNPSFDKGNVYTMAWQSGITGIGYDPKRVSKKPTSWSDLLDPALKGKIGMFGDTEDMPNSALLAIGVKPETSTEADWRKAADWLKKQRPLVRKYYEQDYIDPLSKGDLWASMAWSGDIFQANASGAHLEFVVPKEGAAIWTDNMCIPRHAQHPLDAMIYMDFVYQPPIAAMLADGINYITPVTAAQGVLHKDAADATSKSDKAYYSGLASSPLIFPRKSDYSKLHRYRVLTNSEQRTWNSIFEPIYQS